MHPRRAALTLLAVVSGAAVLGITLAGPGLTAVADATAAATLADLAPHERGLRITTRSAPDPAAQEAEAQALLTAHLPGAAVLAVRQTFPVVSEAGDVVVAHTADWPDRVTLTGTLPAERADGVVEVAAPAGALELGQELTVGRAGVPVLVTATWTPVDPADPLWFADPDPNGAADASGAVGPLWTASAEAVSALVDLPHQRWVLDPPTDLTEAGTARTARRLAEAPDLLADAGLLVRGQVVDGTGPERLAELAAGLRRARALAVVPQLVVAAAGLVAAVAVGRALAEVTRRERELLAARGARSLWSAGRDAPRVGLAGLVGAGAGLVGGLGLLTLLTGAVPGPLVLLPLAGAVALATTVVALAPSRRLAVDRGRAPLPLVAGTVVVAAAVVSAVQLARVGPETRGAAELLAAPAPALLLVLAGVVAARLVRVARAAAPVAARRPGLTPLLTVRYLAAGADPRGAAALALAAGAVVLALGSDAAGPGRPHAVASWAAAGAAALLAPVTLGAGVLGRRAAVRADRDLLVRLGADRPAGAARRAALVIGWAVAAAAGAGVAVLLAGSVTP